VAQVHWKIILKTTSTVFVSDYKDVTEKHNKESKIPCSPISNDNHSLLFG
jgi:hypothetical protein